MSVNYKTMPHTIGFTHNPEVAGSNPAPATKCLCRSKAVSGDFRKPLLACDVRRMSADTALV
jgi:hypothetical protein